MPKQLVSIIAALVAVSSSAAHGGVIHTFTGSLATDDAVALFPLAISQISSLNIFTTSYGGGVNLDGAVTLAGGFVPIISLFSPSGAFIADDGADVSPPGAIDPATGVADDAALSIAGLAPGTYTLAVTEFFNFPNGNLSSGFFASGLGNFTGPTCGQPGASFLQVNLVSCPQRSSAFAVNAKAIVPEPSSYVLLMLGLGALGAFLRGRRRSPSTC